MHEWSIVEALVGRVEAEARMRGATSVQRIEVSLGELSGVEPDLLTSAYELFREQTICKGAGLEIRSVPAVWSCPRCGRSLERGALLRCPSCDLPAHLAAGDEIFLERIEMEVA
jgi:hydrogenase nickel incorporation protein HypA/HybF